jgi:uncharacterized protein (DUF2249 family)
MTREEAYQRILAHHRLLEQELTARVAALWHAATHDGPWQEPHDELLRHLDTEILPHARAEESTIYAAGRAVPGLTRLVAAMVDEHRRLEELTAGIRRSARPLEAGADGRILLELFRSHVSHENDLLLPELQVSAGVDFASLLTAMEEAFSSTAEPDEAVLDVRELPHQERHRLIFGLLTRLDPGQALVLVNDHNPLPLFYQLEAGWPGQFRWQPLTEGPDVWRVRILRMGAPAPQERREEES